MLRCSSHELLNQQQLPVRILTQNTAYSQQVPETSGGSGSQRTFRTVQVSGRGTAFLGDHSTTYNNIECSHLLVVVRHRLDSSLSARSITSWNLPWLLKTTTESIRRSKKDGHESSSYWRLSVVGKYMLSFGMMMETSGDLCLFRPRLQNIVPEDSEFVTSIRLGDVGTIRRLLHARKAGLNCVTPNNRSALFVAIDNEQVVALEELLRQGADCNQSFGIDGTSPLAWAMYKRNSRMVRTLLNYGADTQFMSRRGWSLMFYLWIDQNNPQPSCIAFFKILQAQDDDLMRLAEYSLVDEDGWSLLSRAASSGNRWEIEYLTRCGANIYWKNLYDWNAIFEAVFGNKLDNVEYLVECDRSLLHSKDVRGWTLLHIAAECGYTNMVQYLLEQGLDPGAESLPYQANVSDTLRGRKCTSADVAFAEDIAYGKRFCEILEQVIPSDSADTEI